MDNAVSRTNQICENNVNAVWW